MEAKEGDEEKGRRGDWRWGLLVKVINQEPATGPRRSGPDHRSGGEASEKGPEPEAPAPMRQGPLERRTGVVWRRLPELDALSLMSPFRDQSPL